MPEFTVELKNLKREEDNFKAIRKIIQAKKGEVKSIANNLSLSGSYKGSIADTLKKYVLKLDTLEKNIEKLENTYCNILTTYTTAEAQAKGNNIPNSSSTKKTSTRDRAGRGGGGGGGRHTVSKEALFVSDYEYTYSENDIAVPICIEFLDKGTCLAMADKIIAEHGKDGKCNGMSRMRIAKELYAHAFGYYSGSALEAMGIDGGIVEDLMESGDPANIGLGDGLDVHYNVIWYWMDPFDLDGYFG